MASATQFNLIAGQNISLSPLDFGYQFGLNDNSSQYFNYTDYSVLTNATTVIDTSIEHTQFESTLLEGFPKDTVAGLDVSNVPIKNLDWTSTISINKVSTEVEKEFKGNRALALDITKDVLSTTFGIMQDISSGGSIYGAVIDGTKMVMQAVSTALNVIDSKKTTRVYNDYVNKMVELYNEKTSANYEFIQQATEVFERRSQRYENSNKVINSKQKSRSKSF